MTLKYTQNLKLHVLQFSLCSENDSLVFFARWIFCFEFFCIKTWWNIQGRDAHNNKYCDAYIYFKMYSQPVTFFHLCVPSIYRHGYVAYRFPLIVQHFPAWEQFCWCILLDFRPYLSEFGRDFSQTLLADLMQNAIRWINEHSIYLSRFNCTNFQPPKKCQKYLIYPQGWLDILIDGYIHVSRLTELIHFI